jgi:hypothetical protein
MAQSDNLSKLAEALLADVNKNVTIGNGALAVGATDGFIYLGTCPGIPTGIPTTKTGRTPLIIDSVNNKVYFYNTTWQLVGGGSYNITDNSDANWLTVDVNENADFAGHVKVNNSKPIRLGTANEASIQHNGVAADFYISNTVGKMVLSNDSLGNQIHFSIRDGSNNVRLPLRIGGATGVVQLYDNVNLAMETRLGDLGGITIGRDRRGFLYQAVDGTIYLGTNSGENLHFNIASADVMRMTSSSIVAEKQLYANAGLNANWYAEKQLASSPTATYAADFANGSVFELTLGGNTAITFSNVPATTQAVTATFILKQDVTGNRIPSFPASVKWDGGTVPTWGTANGNEDVITMFTYDAGVTWRANLVGQNYA